MDIIRDLGIKEILVPLGLAYLIIMLYFKIAKKYNIIDKPNERSSHLEPTIRGAGIIFPIMYVLVGLRELTFLSDSYVLIGVFIVATVSFIDDIKPLPNRVRIVAHLVSVLLVLWQQNLFELNIGYLVVIVILFIGILNAYNFMDGINGITGVYSLVLASTLLYITEDVKMLWLISGLIIFNFYNFRKKALCFSGDVGAISLAFIFCASILNLIVSDENWQWIFLLGIYGIDSIVTILVRLYKKENIFKAHRSHLYQLLSNELKIPQLRVSVLYGMIQLILNIVLIYFIDDSPEMIYASFGVIFLVYVIVRRRIKV
jgi:UDP-N-acetylmuramyl pentapeptide phosphotransferase/UDP-N-acetylglucosamine-1-phosphate transferase